MQRSKRYVLISVFSVKDYLGIILITLLIAVVLFPKGKLEQLLPLSTDINLDLSLAYYQAILKTNPSDKIYEAIIQSYIKIGDTKSAVDLAEEFQRKNPNNPETIWLRYQLLKAEFFSQKDESQKEKIKAQMETLLSEYVRLKSDQEVLVKVFKETESMYMPRLAYSTSKLLAIRTKDLFWIKKAYHYSIAFKDYTTAWELVKILVEKEGESWVEEATKIGFLVGDTKKALEYAKLFYDKLPTQERIKLVKEIIDSQLTEKNYLSFRETMLETFPLSPEQRLYLEKEVMKRALWAKDYETLKQLILHNLYLSRTSEYRIFLLELALATGDSKFARDVAEKIHIGGEN